MGDQSRSAGAARTQLAVDRRDWGCTGTSGARTASWACTPRRAAGFVLASGGCISDSLSA